MPRRSTRERCQVCGNRSRAASGVCPPCRRARDGSQAQRPETPCQGPCGKATTAKSGWCLKCSPTYMKQGPITYSHAVWADTPGQWVTVRGVQRWQPTTPTPKKAA